MEKDPAIKEKLVSHYVDIVRDEYMGAAEPIHVELSKNKVESDL